MRYKPVKQKYCPCGCGNPCTPRYDGDRFKGYSHRAPNCPTSFANKHAKNPTKGRKGEANGRWLPDGTTRLHTSAPGLVYRQIKIGGAWVYEHRYVMEQHLGRPLLSTEHVHHKKDTDTLNNALDNLELLTNSAHATHHGTTRPQGWEVFYDGCLLCGTTEKPYCSKGLCITCKNRTYRADNPNKIALYRSTTFLRHKDAIYARNREYDHRVRRAKRRQARHTQG